MIIKEFSIPDLKLNYFVGINQIKLMDKKLDLNQIFDLIETLQKSYEGSIIQFFNEEYVLNQDHVFTACFYVQKAFLNNTNMSNKKNIEFFLYLATNRQISPSIKNFGLNEIKIKKKKYVCVCVISPKNNISEINNAIKNNLGGNAEKDITINDKSIEKFNKIKEYFKISENQLRVVLNSYSSADFNNFQIDGNLDILYVSMHDLICEKMALLSLEKIKVQ